MKKVTMQAIADELNISRVSVWKVLNNQPGVSENLRTTILATANELGYFPNLSGLPAEPYKSAPASMPTVSLVVSRPDSASFWMEIIHQIAQDFTDLGYNLLYTYLPASYTEGYTLPNNLVRSNVDGIIVLNVYNEKMLHLLGSTNIPAVFLDASPDLDFESIHGDLFLLEGEHTIRQITENLVRSGCKRIGFIGDIYYSRTNEERYAGYLSALTRSNLKQDPSICMIRSLGITNYKDEVKDFLSSLDQMPDAFVCANDHIAKVTYDHLTLNGYHIPEQIQLCGYDGDPDYFSNPSFLTTALVDTRQLGRRLVDQLVYRVRFPEAPFEITHILPKLLKGESTL